MSGTLGHLLLGCCFIVGQLFLFTAVSALPLFLLLPLQLVYLLIDCSLARHALVSLVEEDWLTEAHSNGSHKFVRAFLPLSTLFQVLGIATARRRGGGRQNEQEMNKKRYGQQQ